MCPRADMSQKNEVLWILHIFGDTDRLLFTPVSIHRSTKIEILL
jgi:hypothetical protein